MKGRRNRRTGKLRGGVFWLALESSSIAINRCLLLLKVGNSSY